MGRQHWIVQRCRRRRADQFVIPSHPAHIIERHRLAWPFGVLIEMDEFVMNRLEFLFVGCAPLLRWCKQTSSLRLLYCYGQLPDSEMIGE